MSAPTRRARAIRRVPWWGRLESRVITALVAVGILCVGASAYLVKLTIEYFDGLVGAAIERSDQAVDIAAAHYVDLVSARKEAYRARAAAIAGELEVVALREGRAIEGADLEAILAREGDMVALSLLDGERALIEAERRALLPEASGAWIWVAADPIPVASAAAPEADREPELVALFALDPTIERRHQALGRLKRESEHVAVGPAVIVARGELERAAFQAIAAASALVLMVAFIAGFILARSTTRRVSELSRVMRAVAAGDLQARVRSLGQDELGLLGAAFNRMLDELAAAQRTVAYLERVGAWQEMARRIAHEIKNPLTPIQLAVQNLRDKDPGLSPEFSRLLATSVEIVEDEVGALRRMVGTFSQLAKVPEAQLEPVALGRILDEFGRAYGHLTERPSDVLEIAPAPEVEIVGDRQLLKQCLVNLVENAVLSGREAGPAPVRVRIRAAVDADAGAVELWVEDNGPGIAPARRERVFEPYESSRAEGSGLGLAIVKKIILDHHGTIRVEESELGGAAFVIRLAIAG
ncbi:MAG: HAMP domain-containing histidine kinase [Myxococcales bacterium]|nr:HAMP domain-containing histidine kinase [Myxococcales bacterium]